jgi:hypothetical protein
MRYIALLFAILMLAFTVGACKTTPKADPAAQAACKEKAKDADACKKCCAEAGAAGHMFMTGATGCKCL